MHAWKVLPVAVLALLAMPVYAACEHEARDDQDAMRGKDTRAKKSAKAALASCRDSEKARYRSVDNPVINDGPPPKRKKIRTPQK